MKDIQPGTAGSFPRDLTELDGALFFSAYRGSSGAELWRSDGTRAGTVLVKDIWPGNTGSDPHFLIDVGGTLYFAANDGVHGDELWVLRPTPG